MSTELGYNNLPEWDVADRLAKSLRHSNLKVQEMADYLGVHRNSVSAWINGRTPVDERTLKLWAQRTGWPLEWLKNGNGPSQPPTPPHPFARPQAAGVVPVRQLRSAGSVDAGGRDRNRDLVNAQADDRWSWYAQAVADSANRPANDELCPHQDSNLGPADYKSAA